MLRRRRRHTTSPPSRTAAEVGSKKAAGASGVPGEGPDAQPRLAMSVDESTEERIWIRAIAPVVASSLGPESLSRRKRITGPLESGPDVMTPSCEVLSSKVSS